MADLRIRTRTYGHITSPKCIVCAQKIVVGQKYQGRTGMEKHIDCIPN